MDARLGHSVLFLVPFVAVSEGEVCEKRGWLAAFTVG